MLKQNQTNYIPHQIDQQNLNTSTKIQSLHVTSVMPNCTSCGKKMDFVEGDMIYGGDWYHGKCWQPRQERTQNV